MKTLFGLVLTLAVSSAFASVNSTGNEPGTVVYSKSNLTPDANVAVTFHDGQGCDYFGQVVKVDGAWMVPIDLKKCPATSTQTVSMIIPLGEFKQPICAGKELGMFEMNIPLPPGQTTNPGDQTIHLLQAQAVCG